MKQLILKAGMALALSVAGYIFSQFQLQQATAAGRRCRLLLPPGETKGEKESACELKEDHLFVKHDEETLSNVQVETITSATVGLSEISTSSGGEEGYLLPEFNELLEEFNMSERESESQGSHVSATRSADSREILEMEQEIADLGDLVQSLQERERNLEFQLLEYYGLKEQDTAVRELENRLKISNVETRLFSMRIESLQAEKQRLQSLVSDQADVMSELVSAKEKIKALKRQLKSDSEPVKTIAALKEKIAAMEGGEHVDQGHTENHTENLEQISNRLKDLENEAIELKKENSRLAQANADLIKKLESNETLASTIPQHTEVTNALEEANHLRRKNQELLKVIEQLQTDRCADVEELVYLRWVNACLRYELRNYQATGGKTSARDLRKSLSPKSEEKAKQLILEYANAGNTEKVLLDFDSENCSSSQDSCLTENEELDDTTSSSTKESSKSSKVRFLSKIKKLVLGTESHGKRSSGEAPLSLGNSGRRTSISSCSLDDMTSRYFSENSGASIFVEGLSGNQSVMKDGINDEDQNRASCDGTPLDINMLRRQLSERELKHERCKSDLGSSSTYKSFVLGVPSANVSPLGEQLDHGALDSPEKMKLKKFAGALKSNQWLPKVHKRSSSHNM